jgi:hypothetical protein
MKQILLFTLSLVVNSIAFCQIPTLGMQAYWPMNGNYNDVGPYNITGANTLSTATTNKIGTANAAMSFANPTATVAQYGQHALNSNVNFPIAQNFSISFSVFINSPLVHTCGLYDNNLNYGGYGAFFWNSNGFPQIQFYSRNNTVGTPNGAFAIGVWQHLTLVREGSTLKIYVNGVLKASGNEGATPPSYSYPGKFGTMFFNTSAPPNYNGLHGKIDEFRIYNRALIPAEITALASSALPVKLANFAATLLDNQVQLNWQTAQEQNSSHFEIERSADGRNFDMIGQVNALGNSSTLANYNHNDKLNASIAALTNIYYRLKSVDVDGTFSYSKIISIHLKKTYESLLLYPNPAKDDVNVQAYFSVDAKAALQVIDIFGKVVLQKDIHVLKGRNSFQVDVSLLKSGLYHLKINENEVSLEKTFLKIQ